MEVVLRAEEINGSSLDILEHQIRLSIRSQTGVIQTSDVRMLEGRKDLPLSLHPFGQTISSPSSVSEFQGNRPVEHLVCAFGQPDRAHSTASELANQVVWSDDAS